MANSTRDNRRRNRTTSHQMRSSSSRRGTRSNSSSRARSTQGQSRRGTLTRPDTGYSLRTRRVRREPGGAGVLSFLLRPRVLIFILILVVVAVVMVVGVSSCIRRGHESTSQKIEEAKPKNEQDERVAAGVSAALTSKFTEELDSADTLSTIAKNADQYEDARLLELALAEPSSRDFIAAYPKSDKSSRPYDSSVKRGEVPQLFDWDEHWGAVTYGDGPLAITGSGPTTLAMAYMGLTGKTDFSPTEIAQQSSKANYADGDSGSKGEMFSKLPASMGLTANEYDAAADTLSTSLGDSTVIAAEVKEGTLTDSAHWVLVVNVNADGSVTVFDPTSTAVSSRPWDASTIAEASTKFYAISPSKDTASSLDKEDTESSSSSNTNSSSSTSTSTSSTSTSSSSRAETQY